MKVSPLQRWRSRPAGGSTLEDDAAEWLREVQVPEMPDEALARVARRIAAQSDSHKRPWLDGRPLQWALLALLLGTTLTAAAALIGVRLKTPRHEEGARAIPTQPGPAPSAGAAAQATTGEQAIPAPERADTPPPPPAFAPKTSLTRTASRAPLTPSPLSQEAALLQTAIEALNVHNQPAAALAKLDLYRQRYPGGVLANEAEIARVDALLRLGQPEVALGLLDRAATNDFEGYPRPSDLRVLRAELMAKAGRCTEAVAIFSGVLSDSGAGPSAERALYGRAACRAATGEADGSRADLDQYLRLYPQGHFAREAERALAR
jgi:tetratricopeptide (TPR) repeat protein